MYLLFVLIVFLAFPTLYPLDVFGLKMVKVIAILVPRFLPVSIVVNNENKTMVSLQPQIRAQMGLRPTDFVQLGYQHRRSGSDEIETVHVPNTMTVRNAYDLIIQVSSFFCTSIPRLVHAGRKCPVS